jgi:hypothetical protein
VKIRRRVADRLCFGEGRGELARHLQLIVDKDGGNEAVFTYVESRGGREMVAVKFVVLMS